jgi:hypothetical protein
LAAEGTVFAGGFAFTPYTVLSTYSKFSVWHISVNRESFKFGGNDLSF